MTGAAGTIRAVTEERLVLLAGLLDGWQTSPDDDALWWSTGQINGSRTNARVCIFGQYDGEMAPESHQAGADPSIDVWTIKCGLGLVGVEEALAAKQEVEAALNQLADMLAVNHRLVDPEADPSWLGCEQLRIERIDGPYHVAEQGATPLAWIDFDIAARAQITRNPS